MSDTPLYDATLAALLADDPLAPDRSARSGRHRLRVDPPRPPAPPPGRPLLPGEPAQAALAPDPFHTSRKDTAVPDNRPPTSGDPDTLAVLAPVELIETDDEPTARPPETWDPDAHLAELRADPDVELIED